MVYSAAVKELVGQPSTLARLAQGSNSRTLQIEAFRQAELVRRVNPISNLTSGEITKKRLGITAVGTAGLVTLVAVIACKGGQGQGVEVTPTQSATSPVATETIAPTPSPVLTEAPTVAPTEVPTETPPTFEELLGSYRTAYSKLDSATLASLPQNATLADIERNLRTCNEENIPDSASYASFVIGGCTIIPQNIGDIPGAEDIEEFHQARELLTSFAGAKIDSLNERHMFPDDQGKPTVSVSQKELEEYKQAIIDQINPK